MFKKILRTLLFILLGVLVLIGATLLIPKAEAQQQLTPSEIMPVRQFDSLYWAMQREILQKEFGEHKTLLPGFELQCLLALRHFPELKDARIRFVYQKALIPLASRPAFFSLFGKRSRREYRIIVSKDSGQAMEPILLKNLPFDAQVAILAHELGHAAHYEQLSTWGLFKFGLLYLVSADFRARHERSTDERVIYHALGWQLFEYARYVRTAPDAVSQYEAMQEFLDSTYLTPSDILEALGRVPIYGLSAPY